MRRAELLQHLPEASGRYFMAKRKRSKYRADKRNPRSFTSVMSNMMDDMMRRMGAGLIKELHNPNPFETLLNDSQLYGTGMIKVTYGKPETVYPKMYPSLKEFHRIQDEIDRVSANIKWATKLMAIPRLFVPDACEHTYIKYVGLTESYNYCSKCDYKDKL